MKIKVIEGNTPKLENHKTISQLLSEDYKTIKKFFKYALKRNDCAGLASNQCSVDGKRILQPYLIQKDVSGGTLMLLPKIKKYIGTQELKLEGCLSWPGKEIKAKRHEGIEIEYYTIHGEKKLDIIYGYRAQIIQHEVDHLNGVAENVI